MAKNCTNCARAFNFLSAFKYTCAACGQAFCSSCCNCSIALKASYFTWAAPSTIKDNNKPQKCCQACSDRISSLPTGDGDSAKGDPKRKEIHDLYDLGKVLGEGGFGIVKEGISKVDKSVVAVKMLLKDKVPADEESAIYNEVKVLSQLKHRNIVRLFDFLVEPTCFYIIMECVDGGELFDRIVAKTVYNELEARELVIVVLNAIKYLHDKHVVHRDLKPENLLLTSREDDADIKIVDFGFAVIAEEQTITDTVGTPSYIAPEILNGDAYGKPVDMWAFGVILYILLGGYPPFHDQDQGKLFKKIARGAYQFHVEYWQGISGEAKDLIRGLLVLDSDNRLTVDQALAHPWLRLSSKKLQERNLENNLKELRKFQAAKKWKAGYNAVRAVNKMKRLSMSHASGDVEVEEEAPHSLEARYELGKVLGEGGYAIVKHGVSKLDKSKVAIKVVKRQAMSADQESSLRSEVAILQSLKHPNIVSANEFFEEKDFFYVVMELITGGELFDRIVKKVCYAEKDARDLATVLLKAIKYLHDQNIVHRDLKPENLLLTSEHNDADVKIVDFGFADKAENDNCLVAHCGTPGYIAPEILRNESYGKPVDMWSFGVILYILLGGYPPFYDKNTQTLFRKILKGQYEFHPAYWHEVSDEAKDLIRKLLQLDPRVRLSVDEALAHPWFQTAALQDRMLNTGLSELRKFQVRRKFRASIKVVMTINRMKWFASASRSSKKDAEAAAQQAGEGEKEAVEEEVQKEEVGTKLDDSTRI